MRLAEHLTVLCAWCNVCLVGENLTCPVWLVKTWRAPSRHCRDVRVYRRTTKAMHDVSTRSLSPPEQPPPRTVLRGHQRRQAFVGLVKAYLGLNILLLVQGAPQTAVC